MINKKRYSKCYVLIFAFILLTITVLPAEARAYSKLDDYLEIPHSSIHYLLEEDSSNPNSNDTNSQWTPFTHQKSSRDGLIWIRISLSQMEELKQTQESLKIANQLETIQLFLYPTPSYYEVYQDNQLIYQAGKLNNTDPRLNVPRWDIIPLTSASENIYIRLQGKVPYLYTIGQEADLIGFIYKEDAINLVSIIGFMVTGLLAFFLYLYNRKLRLLLYYALFIIVHFSLWPSVTYLISKQLFLPMGLVSEFYFSVIGQVLAFLLLLLLFREIIHPAFQRWVLWCTYLFSGVGIIGITATAIHSKIVFLLFPMLSILITIAMLFILVISVLSIKRQKSSELVLFTSGLVLFIVLEIALNIALTAKLIDVVNGIKIIRPFTIVLPGAMIIIRRYQEASRQVIEYAASLRELSSRLEEDNLQLEQRVLERTKELEETHQQLVNSIQEGTAATVEIAALEERNRIAQEIHDIVGHTLTTTIVQIEAGKRLIYKQPEQAVKRMETSQKLIRKGLDEIRTSVRLLKDAEWNYDLKNALIQIIDETKEYAGVQINSAISDLPELTIIQKNVIFMALKEGMTNGIKHGECQTFYFSLTVQDDWIIFQLKNDGKAALNTELGFGLTTMTTRVESIQGKLQQLSEEEWNYVLDIRFPV
ncbi:sensor histidine kinase [Ornithinibacillus californiensis]|uniref:sensor histidine kinase n=1 Tax=Ornithinibacillus californiensis TaxID=161536 RepID=UPI00069D4804|nr:histidine kinase [Ornithinibacillus californiensis]